MSWSSFSASEERYMLPATMLGERCEVNFANDVCGRRAPKDSATHFCSRAYDAGLL